MCIVYPVKYDGCGCLQYEYREFCPKYLNTHRRCAVGELDEHERYLHRKGDCLECDPDRASDSLQKRRKSFDSASTNSADKKREATPEPMDIDRDMEEGEVVESIEQPPKRGR